MRSSTRLLLFGGSQFIGDLLSVRAAAVYGMRRFYSNYLGFAIRVRRSSDNAELDTGFTSNGDLDIDTLLAFVGAGNGFVTTWYDQSGNVRNVTQATAANQPQIVTSGVVNTENGKPAIRFNGTTASLVNTSVGLPVGTSARTMNVAYKPQVTTGTNAICGQGAAGSTIGQWFTLQSRQGPPTGNPYFAGLVTDLTDSQAPTLAYKIATATFDSATLTLFRDGTEFATQARALNTAGNSFNVGVSPNGVEWGNLSISEITFFPSVLLHLDRQLLERSQGNYFGITVV